MHPRPAAWWSLPLYSSFSCSFCAEFAVAVRDFSVRDVLFGRQWLPISEPPKFGILPLLVGSVWSTFWAIVICVPLGVAAAMFIAEVAPRPLKHVLSR